MTPAVQALWQQGRQTLRDAGIDNANLDARLLLQEALSWTQAQLMSGGDDTVDADTANQYQLLLNRRAGHEPVSRIVGCREFWSLDFQITPAVLDPRPDTETLVQAVLDDLSDKKAPLTIVDLGTGTGCILIALLTELPAATGIAVDQSADALDVARGNATSLGVSDRMTFIQSNWGQMLESDCADIVVSNPPYIDSNDMQQLMPEVALFDPPEALDGGEKGMDDYRKVMADLSRILRPNGRFYLEVGIGQSGQIIELIEEITVMSISIVQDLAGVDRVVASAI
ncbi:MAG: peptide chain release factor N(5)-glutamine methyltransferase [Alphaproteobacteria bacterium]|nr:MAG: peptide chain release factor N(5)-glutamine methyltransferase [Alphaproteobacteria bacterium]